MNRIQITGILPALVSPVNEDGSIREAALRKLVRDLARTGISGFYLCGATGEGIAMAPERRMELVEIVKDEAPSGMKLINHIGAADLATVRRLARHSRQMLRYILLFLAACLPRSSERPFLQFIGRFDILHLFPVVPVVHRQIPPVRV